MKSNGSVHPPHAVILRQQSLAKPRTPNEGSLHTADTTTNEGCPIYALFAKGGSVELYDIRTLSCFLPLLCHPVRSRGTCFSADTRHQSPCDKSVARTNSRSFDSGNELASNSVPCAQDDNFEKEEINKRRSHIRRVVKRLCSTTQICHPEAAESLAKPRTPNEGSLHFADTTRNEGCPTFSVLCERWKRRTPRQTNFIVRPTSPLSSRAEKDRPRADDLAESRDLLFCRHSAPITRRQVHRAGEQQVFRLREQTRERARSPHSR